MRIILGASRQRRPTNRTQSSRLRFSKCASVRFLPYDLRSRRPSGSTMTKLKLCHLHRSLATTFSRYFARSDILQSTSGRSLRSAGFRPMVHALTDLWGGHGQDDPGFMSLRQSPLRYPWKDWPCRAMSLLEVQEGVRHRRKCSLLHSSCEPGVDRRAA